MNRKYIKFSFAYFLFCWIGISICSCQDKLENKLSINDLYTDSLLHIEPVSKVEAKNVINGLVAKYSEGDSTLVMALMNSIQGTIETYLNHEANLMEKEPEYKNLSSDQIFSILNNSSDLKELYSFGLSITRNMVQRFPNSGDLFYYSGYYKYFLKDYNAAISDFDLAIFHNSKLKGNCYEMKAWCYVAENDKNSACSSFRMARDEGQEIDEELISKNCY